MKKIIDWIIGQGHKTTDTYQELVIPLSEKFDLVISCAQSVVDTVVEWEIDSNTIDSLEDLLNKRFPDIVIK